MHIRATAPHDAEALTDLHLDVWEETYAGLIDADLLNERRAGRDRRIDNWRKFLANSATTHLVAQASDNRLIGFVSAGAGRDEPYPDVPTHEVMALYVRAEKHGLGVGYALLRNAISNRAAYLWVLDGNLRAVNFYERQGFHFDGANKTASIGLEHRMVRP